MYQLPIQQIPHTFQQMLLNLENLSLPSNACCLIWKKSKLIKINKFVLSFCLWSNYRNILYCYRNVASPPHPPDTPPPTPPFPPGWHGIGLGGLTVSTLNSRSSWLGVIVLHSLPITLHRALSYCFTHTKLYISWMYRWIICQEASLLCGGEIQSYRSRYK